MYGSARRSCSRPTGSPAAGTTLTLRAPPPLRAPGRPKGRHHGDRLPAGRSVRGHRVDVGCGLEVGDVAARRTQSLAGPDLRLHRLRWRVRSGLEMVRTSRSSSTTAPGRLGGHRLSGTRSRCPSLARRCGWCRPAGRRGPPGAASPPCGSSTQASAVMRVEAALADLRRSTGSDPPMTMSAWAPRCGAREASAGP